MNTFRLCLRCPGKFSELLPDTLEVDKIIVEDLISRALKGLPLIARVDKVEINFSHLTNTYAIQIRIRCDECFKGYLADIGDISVRIEGLLGQSLPQLFWEGTIDHSDC